MSETARESASLVRDDVVTGALPEAAATWKSLAPTLRAALAITGIFAAIVLFLGWSYDLPLLVPQERVSRALGVSAALPVAFGLIAYLFSQALRRLSGGAAASGRGLVATVGRDLTILLTFVVLSYFHFNLKMWSPLINPLLFDQLYYQWDKALSPLVELCLTLRGAIAPLLPQADYWYQGAFHLMFVGGFCMLAISGNRQYGNFVIGIFLVLSFGCITYLIAPAVGPFYFEEGLNAKATAAQIDMMIAFSQVQREGADWVSRFGPIYFTGSLAAMPSLHVAHATVITWSIFQARLWVVLPLFGFLWFWILIESVASRWHYLVDAPAGLAVAAIAIWLANRLCDRSDRP